MSLFTQMSVDSLVRIFCLGLPLNLFMVVATCFCAIIALRQFRRTPIDYSSESRWQARIDEAARVSTWVLCFCGFGLPVAFVAMDALVAYEETLKLLTQQC
jgi:hypothetical protein